MWKWGGSFIATSDTFDNATNTQSLGGYATLDVHALYAASSDWTVLARIINVGDKFYQTANGYNQPGRAAYVTLRYQPK
jgi:vitamin B12 transporter